MHAVSYARRTSDCREKSKNRGVQCIQGAGEAKRNASPTIVVVANSCVLKYLPSDLPASNTLAVRRFKPRADPGTSSVGPPRPLSAKATSSLETSWMRPSKAVRVRDTASQSSDFSIGLDVYSVADIKQHNLSGQCRIL